MAWKKHAGGSSRQTGHSAEKRLLNLHPLNPVPVKRRGSWGALNTEYFRENSLENLQKAASSQRLLWRRRFHKRRAMEFARNSHGLYRRVAVLGCSGDISAHR